MTAAQFLRERYALVYPAWLLVCALLFVAFRGAEDPSRRADRVDNDEAGRRAIAFLQKGKRAKKYPGYTPVQITYARKGELRDESVWVVLCDQAPRTRLQKAIVVELDARTGKPLRLRRPRT